MLRSMLVAVLLVMGVPCFSLELPQPPEGATLDETLAFSYVRCANDCLFHEQYERAIDAFKNALLASDQSKISAEILQFWSLIGKIIAYDCMGMRNWCLQSIGELTLLTHAHFENDTDDADVVSDEGLSPEEVQQVELIRKLVSLAPSSDVRNLLFSLVKEMAD
jgi:hypothetical protein